MNETVKIGSICCGMGGFDEGLRRIGFETVWAIDIMKQACDSFKANFPECNVLNIDAHKVIDFKALGDIQGLVFGVPCQPFSLGNTKRTLEDKRSDVYKATLRALEEINPDFFIFENVKGLLSMKFPNGDLFFPTMREDYEKCGFGYNLKWKLIDCAKVGVPQVNRERIIMVGIRKDIQFTYQFDKFQYGEGGLPYVTLRDTIYHLKDIDQRGGYDTSGFSSMYLGRNRQKTWDEPSYTIEASGRQAKLHPDYGKMYKVATNKWIIPDSCRKLSALECKLIQTFPEDYIVSGTLNKQYEQIGNAVPPKLATFVGLPILEIYKN